VREDILSIVEGDSNSTYDATISARVVSGFAFACLWFGLGLD
jgi:hypothetical protein